MARFTFLSRTPQKDYDIEQFLTNDETAEITRSRRILPAEWQFQCGVQITWPHSETDWAPVLPDITKTYLRLAFEIATREKLLIVTPNVSELQALLEKQLPKRAIDNIVLFECPTNDTWARDHGFITIIGETNFECLDYCLNGWGGKFESEKDNAINALLSQSGLIKGKYVDCLDFVLEGGSIESDGKGTLLTTTSCLLGKNRNGNNKSTIEERLTSDLGVRRILWLSHGKLEGDDTDGHIDTIARFCPGDTIAYVRCNDPDDSHYDDFKAMEEELQQFTTENGTPYNLVPLPFPDAIFGDDGHRLPATYANFLILNDSILLPTYNQPINDNKAMQTLQRIFPKFGIIPIDSTILIQQHGSIHCATMQFPRGSLNI